MGGDQCQSAQHPLLHWIPFEAPSSLHVNITSEATDACLQRIYHARPLVQHFTHLTHITLTIAL